MFVDDQRLDVAVAFTLHKARKVKKAVDRGLGWALVGLMGAAVVNVLWQVFTRFVLSEPSAFTDELARYLLIWVGLLGAAYAAGQRMHLAIDLLPGRLEGRAGHALSLFIEACVFLFALAVMVVGGFRLVGLTLFLGQTSAALRLPLGYVYLVLPLSGLLIMFYAGVYLAERLRLLRGAAPTPEAKPERRSEAFAEGATAGAPPPPSPEAAEPSAAESPAAFSSEHRRKK